jgi:uncharacterized protein YbjT (DUF2867 family)
MTNNVLVLGATGKTGSRVMAQLEAQGVDVRAGSRAATPRFDWEDASTWAPALQGIDAAYITYQPDLAFPEAGERIEGFVRQAVASGVRRLVLLSGRNEEGALRGERAVQDSGAEWTVVRASFMMQNFSESFWLDSVRAGELVAPAGNVVEPFIDCADIADIVVAALTTDAHVNRLYEVSGPRLLSFAEAAQEMSQAIGRPVNYIPVTTQEFEAGMVAEGVPVDFAKDLTELFGMVLDGRNAYLSDGVQQALGRAPRDFADFAREAAASGVWA